jgi:antirestriction protein ArdC
MATASNFIPQTAENPTRSKLQQSIRESTEKLAALLQAGKTESLTQYLATMARFHSYSFGNQLLIATQKPNATHVCGFRKWNEFNRYVRKGEKGIAILAPMMVKDKSENESKPGPRLIGFRVVYVFDISQTDGEPLKEFSLTVSGDPGSLIQKLIAHIQASGTTVSYDAGISPALGMCSASGIQLLPGQPAAQEFSTLVHEYAHALLHRGERRQETTKTIRETEAEAVAFIVSTASGLDCGNSASDYIQLYNGDVDTLTESLQHIQSAAAVILAAIEDAK